MTLADILFFVALGAVVFTATFLCAGQYLALREYERQHDAERAFGERWASGCDDPWCFVCSKDGAA